MFPSKSTLKVIGECVLIVVYLINQTPTKVLYGKTLHEILFQKMSTFHQLRVFSCLCFGCNIDTKHKFDVRASPKNFVKYPFGQKGYKIFNLQTQKFYANRDIIFHENVF